MKRWLFVVGLTVVPAFAAAAAELSPAAQQALTEGSAAFRRGQASSDRQDFLAAIDLFQRARRDAPEAPEVLFYLGAAEANVAGRELRAIAWYGAYLAVRPDASNADRVRAEITRLRLVHHDTLLAVISEVEKAARFAERPGPSLRDVVHRLADLGDLASARRVAASLTEYPTAQAEAYGWIAKAQSGAGDLDGALATLRLVDDKQPDKSDTWATIVQRWIPRDLAAVRRMIAQMADARTRDGVLFQIAVFQARSGQAAAALETAGTLADEENRSSARREVAFWGLNEKGDLATAAAVIPLLRAGRLEHIEVVRLVSLTQAKKGDFGGALRTAAMEKFPENAASLYTDIAEIQAENGDGSGALKTVALIMPERRDATRNQVQLALARGLWKRGEVAEARRILASARQAVELIADTDRKDGFWRNLARLEAEFKDMAAALADAARMQGEYLKAETQKDLAKMQAEQGDITGAVRTAAAIQFSDPTMTRNYALHAVAQIQAKQGDAAGAWRTAEMLTGEGAKDSLRRAVAENQAEAGDFAAARKSIALIRDAFEERQASAAVDAARDKLGDRLTLWLQRLEDSNLDHDGALNAGLFLDQARYLRSLAASEEPKKLFAAYYRAYIDLGDAEKIILQLLQPQPAP